MKSVYAREEVCIGCGLRAGNREPAHSRSKDFIKAFKGKSLRPLLLGSNGDLGGREE